MILDKLNEDEKVCYGVGALASYTCWVQEKERVLKDKSGSFRRKFYNLKLNKTKLKRIFTECIEKLNQYGYPVKKEIKELIGLKDIDNINLSNIEISYYFALGFILGIERGEHDE
jgi:CRISPR-associated protein Cas8b/Csh1 subtype I-B